MDVVTWASEAHKPTLLPPRLGDPMPAKPCRSASMATSRIAWRRPGGATRESAGMALSVIATEPASPAGAVRAPGYRHDVHEVRVPTTDPRTLESVIGAGRVEAWLTRTPRPRSGASIV